MEHANFVRDIMKVRPFLINSNLCTCAKDVSTCDSLMRTIAGNVGNSYISYALIKECCGKYIDIPQIKSLYTYDFDSPDKDLACINDECTHVFLVLQDQIRIHESYGLKLPYKKIIRFLRRVKIPIVIAGLGANSLCGYDVSFHKKLSRELIEFLSELSQLTNVIGVRGDFTRDVLNKLGIRNVETIGCPSYYEMGAKRVVLKRGYESVACSSGVSGVIMDRSQIYLQDETRIVQSIAYGSENFIEPNEMKYICERKYRFFSDIQGWKQSVSGHSFFVGCRVHGAILALNSGVPAVVMNGDSRAREMCEYLNIPYFPELRNEKSIQKIYEMCDYEKMNREYDEKYKAFWSFMRRNGVFEQEIACNGSDKRESMQPNLPCYENVRCRPYRTPFIVRRVLQRLGLGCIMGV